MKSKSIEGADFYDTGYYYTLTKRGHSLVKVLDKLCDWGNANRV